MNATTCKQRFVLNSVRHVAVQEYLQPVVIRGAVRKNPIDCAEALIQKRIGSLTENLIIQIEVTSQVLR